MRGRASESQSDAKWSPSPPVVHGRTFLCGQNARQLMHFSIQATYPILQVVSLIINKKQITDNILKETLGSVQFGSINLHNSCLSL